ncbi:MAG: hypothetical protein ACRDNK_11835 [Solirubrobacteraceae bacterium]
MSARRRITGDSPRNVRDGRGSKGSCLVRAAELVGFGGIVAATALAALAGCADGVLPSRAPEPARAPRPPADEVDAALAQGDTLARMLHTWRADIDSVPFRTNNSSAPEATR